MDCTVRSFRYLRELDAFVVTDAYHALAEHPRLPEWHPVVWIGRLSTLDNDYGEHWFDNWDEREEQARAALAGAFGAAGARSGLRRSARPPSQSVWTLSPWKRRCSGWSGGCLSTIHRRSRCLWSKRSWPIVVHIRLNAAPGDAKGGRSPSRLWMCSETTMPRGSSGYYR